MAEPLSITASISGLVTLADTVFCRIYNYVKAVKKAPKEVSALSAEIGALYGVLSNLRLVSCQLEDEQAGSTTRVHHIQSCYQTLEHVKSILDKDDTSLLRDEKIENFKRRLKWPFKSSEVKELIAEIDRHKATLGLALNVDCMSGLLRALSQHDEIRNTIDGMRIELKERHEAATRIEINKERQQILNSFAKADSRSNYDISRKLRMPGTGLWLTDGQEFRHWLETDNARLWFYGIPGAGKTVLASSVIEEALRKSGPTTAVAFFYCDYKDTATQDLSNILCSLAYQFAKQHEESFAKLRDFYTINNPEHRPDVKYDSEDLLDLVRAVTLVFDSAMIIVDGLDECGKNTPIIVDALTSLNDGEDITVKTVFLSRNEIEIHERLEKYTKVSIAAKSSDLKLYVGAEIDLRMRQKRLRIKDQSLKGHILERLVEGADGMFRWVACQMDYLCELPNDAARRKALNSLPPDLNSTYERILSRVNHSNLETQKLVQRALRWIAGEFRDFETYNSIRKLSTEALCEAVSVDLGSKQRNSQAIPDEFDILHWCSSLVRKTVYGRLEFAHFTVQEFLQQIDPERNPSIGAYRIDFKANEIIYAKVYLTYLNFEDFNHSNKFSHQAIERRIQEYPFRGYAISSVFHAARGYSDDDEIFPLLQKLLSPSKPNTFISWMHDTTKFFLEILPTEERSLGILNSGFAETSVLHWAAMLGLAKVCSWLVESGCDVNRDSAFGTPLHGALMEFNAVLFSVEPESHADDNLNPNHDVVEFLLEAGADPKCCYHSRTGNISTLNFALSSGLVELVILLLDHREVLDNSCLEMLEHDLESEETYKIVSHTSNHNLRPDHYGRFLEITLKVNAFNTARSMDKVDGLPLQNSHYEHMLRTAAGLGQVDIATSMLEDHKVDPNAAEEGTGLTALHQAVKTDQLVVVKILIDHGANWSTPDGEGKTALHHSVHGRQLGCLEFLLCQGADTSLQDLEGMTVWHLAARESNVQALSILLNRPVNIASVIGLKAKDGRSALLYVSSNKSEEAMKLLINAGSSLSDTASDGSSPLHYAASSGSLEVAKFIFGQGTGPSVVNHDGSSAIHYAIENNRENLGEMLHILIENGVDASQPRKDGRTPLELIVRVIKANSPSPDQLNCLFNASQTLLKSLLEKSRSACNIQQGSELIYLACSFDFASAHETVSALLELDLDCNIPFDGGRTALMAAAEKGRGAIFSTLLLHGADPCAGGSGLTALHYSCFDDHKDIVVRLRETDIDWNSNATATICGKSREKVTALHIAAAKENSEVLKYLLNEDLVSDINARNNYGETPLSIAVWAASPRNVSLLLSNGADTSCVDTFGSTAIHWAAKDGSEDIITEFIEFGSDLGLLNSRGLTPELVARKYDHADLANTIMDYVNEQSLNSNASPHSQSPRATHSTSEALKIAIDLGDLTFCMRLSESGINLASGFDWCMGCTPLLYSLHKGEIAIAEYLVSQGVSTAGSTCRAFDTAGFTAFHYAAAWSSVELLRSLFEKSPSEIYVNHHPIHPIHLAVLNNSAECVKLILDHISQGEGRNLSNGHSALPKALDQLLDIQVAGDRLCRQGQRLPEEWFPKSLETATPLHIAVDKGNFQIVEMLLGHGAFVDSVDGDFATPLHYAACGGETAITSLLLDAGANPNNLNSKLESPYMCAVANGHVDSVRVLEKGGADTHLRNRYGETVLHRAARSGAKNLLVSFSMDPATRQDLDAENVFGQSFLFQAVREPSIPMSYLLNLALPAKAYEAREVNLLNRAIKERSTAEAKMLLRRVPTSLRLDLVNRRDYYTETPLSSAIRLSKVDLITLLLEAGAQLELEGSAHGTALMMACATGRLAAVKLLVARGARTSYVNDDGLLLSAFAAAKNFPLIRRWLLVGRFLEGSKLLM